MKWLCGWMLHVDGGAKKKQCSRQCAVHFNFNVTQTDRWGGALFPSSRATISTSWQFITGWFCYKVLIGFISRWCALLLKTILWQFDFFLMPTRIISSLLDSNTSAIGWPCVRHNVNHVRINILTTIGKKVIKCSYTLLWNPQTHRTEQWM